MRSCTSATNSFGSVMTLVQDLSVSPFALSRHSSDRARCRQCGRAIARLGNQLVQYFELLRRRTGRSAAAFAFVSARSREFGVSYGTDAVTFPTYASRVRRTHEDRALKHLLTRELESTTKFDIRRTKMLQVTWDRIVATTTNPNLLAVTICLVGCLIAVSLILRFPDAGLTVEQPSLFEGP